MTDDIRDLFSYRLARLARANDRDAQSSLFNRYGMVLSEWRTLSVIRVTRPCTLRRLATEDFLDEGQVSRTVKMLVDRGWVTREPAPGDGRSFLLTLTAEGEAVYQAILPEVVEANEAMLDCLDPDERLHLMDALQKVLDALRALARNGGS